MSALRRAVLLAASFSVIGCGSWETSHELEIAASDETVWRVLTELERYPEWNTYSPSAEGELRVGGIVRIEARLGDEIQIVDNRVTELEERRRLCWQSMNWYRFLVRGTRCRELEPLGNGRTHFRHHEVMEGPLAKLVERIYRPRIEAGLAKMDDALRRAAEAADD